MPKIDLGRVTGCTSYNQLTDKPCGFGPVERVVIVDDAIIHIPSGGIWEYEMLMPGQLYEMTINGMTREFQSFAGTAGEVEYASIGDKTVPSVYGFVLRTGMRDGAPWYMMSHLDQMKFRELFGITDEQWTAFVGDSQAEPPRITVTHIIREVNVLDHRLVPGTDYDQNDPEGAGYIDNRPCYFGQTQEEAVLQGTALMITGEPAPWPGEEMLVAGAAYKLTLNGITVELVAFEESADGAVLTQLGDSFLALLESNETGTVFTAEYGFSLGTVNMDGENRYILMHTDPNVLCDAFGLQPEQLGEMLDAGADITLVRLQQQIKTLDPRLLPEIGSGMPAVTEADNGKIAMVVDGKWQIVTFPAGTQYDKQTFTIPVASWVTTGELPTAQYNIGKQLTEDLIIEVGLVPSAAKIRVAAAAGVYCSGINGSNLVFECLNAAPTEDLSFSVVITKPHTLSYSTDSTTMTLNIVEGG